MTPLSKAILKHFWPECLCRYGVWGTKLKVFEFPVHLKWFQVILGIRFGFTSCFLPKKLVFHCLFWPNGFLSFPPKVPNLSGWNFNIIFVLSICFRMQLVWAHLNKNWLSYGIQKVRLNQIEGFFFRSNTLGAFLGVKGVF